MLTTHSMSISLFYDNWMKISYDAFIYLFYIYFIYLFLLHIYILVILFYLDFLLLVGYPVTRECENTRDSCSHSHTRFLGWRGFLEDTRFLGRRGFLEDTRFLGWRGFLEATRSLGWRGFFAATRSLGWRGFFETHDWFVLFEFPGLFPVSYWTLILLL